MQTATANRVTQAMFLEGGLSRDGRIQPPRFGLLSYLVRAAARPDVSDVVFIPVAINYDRVLEDRTLIAGREGYGYGPSRLQAAITAARWIGKNLVLYVRGRLQRFGYACVNVGEPISLKACLAQIESAAGASADGSTHKIGRAHV